jgi:hypothetical protein
MEAVLTFESSVNIYLTTRQYIPEDSKLHEQKYFARPNSSLPSPVPPACCQMTAGRIARALVDEWGVLDRRHHATIVLHDHVSPGDEKEVCWLRSSET